MRSKELSVELRDRIVSRHRSGEWYQNISAALKVPKNLVLSNILKWKKFGTTETLPRAGRSGGDQEPDCQSDRAPEFLFLRPGETRSSDLMKPGLNSLAWMTSVTSGGNLAPFLRWSMVVAASCCGYVFQRHGTGRLVRIEERWAAQSTDRSLMKTCSRALRTSDWTFKQDNDPKHTKREHRSGFGTSL